MLKNTDKEVDYRLAKWIIRNMEKEKLLEPEEIQAIWQELLNFYDPPTKTVETVCGMIRTGGDNE